VLRRALAHPLAPAVAGALAGLAYLAAAPATADMAAHTYRTWLFRQEGLAVWNAQWYGGHHVLGYSLLFSPLAALLSPALTGVAAAVAAVAGFAPLARAAAPTPRAAAVAAWLFAGGVLSNVVIGRMPFVLGIALATGAWLCARRAPARAWAGGAGALALALAAVWASPVAGAFLLLTAAAAAAAGGRRAAGRAALLAAPVLAGGLALWLLFPEGGDDRFAARAFWPVLALCAAGIALLSPARRALWAGAVLAAAVLVAAFAIPSPFGQNALRLPLLLGPPLLVLARRRRAPVLALAAVGAGLLYLQWLPAVRAVAEAHGDPSTRTAFQAEARRFLARVVRPGERVEVAFTRNHWEAADLATAVPLARGWERQLDQKANPLFYDGRALTPARYHAWLRENAVRWVALPAAPLDYSALAEARLLRRGPPFLRLAHRSARWRVWEVRGTDPPASAGARVLGAGPDWFEVDSRRPTIVRQRYTPYWDAPGACVREAPGGWTEVDPRGRGGAAVLVVRARFGLRPARGSCRGLDGR
jgi:hypothetical protein